MKVFENEIIMNIAQILLIILIAFLFYKIVIRIIRKALDVQIGKIDIVDRRQRSLDNLFTNLLKTVVLAAMLVAILNVLGVSTSSILASLGIVSVVIGLAFQDILKDLLAGIFILMEGNYTIGDLVEISGFKGEITEIGIKTTKIKAYTGEIKIFSNRNISEVINYSINDVITIIDMKFAYNENKEKVEKIMNKLTEKINSNYGDIADDVEYLGVEDIKENLVVYRIVLSSDLNNHFSLRRNILGDIKSIFEKENINMPYQRIEIKNENI